MHAVNNVGVGVVTITYGGYADSFVSETTTGSPWDFFPGVVVHALAVALILWQARRVRIDRTTRPGRSRLARGPSAARPAGRHLVRPARPLNGPDAATGRSRP